MKILCCTVIYLAAAFCVIFTKSKEPWLGALVKIGLVVWAVWLQRRFLKEHKF